MQLHPMGTSHPQLECLHLKEVVLLNWEEGGCPLEVTVSTHAVSLVVLWCACVGVGTYSVSQHVFTYDKVLE